MNHKTTTILSALATIAAATLCCDTLCNAFLKHCRSRHAGLETGQLL